jgi:glycosidase
MMMKFFLIVSTIAFSLFAEAQEIERMEPPFWWTGMKNSELQIMVYGKNIARAELQFEYPDVHLKEIVRADSPDYLFIYMEIGKDAQPGMMKLNFSEGKKKRTETYELRARHATVGAQGFASSDVLYLIMPDRFANGDPSNDVRYNEPVDRKDPSGRHGGDFAGIAQHLDYLVDLGVTTIWLNPVMENNMHAAGYQSYHGYAATDFYRTDERFGSNEDYCRLIESVHQKGMKMVMDMIYNHCGSLHRWINNLPFRNWLNHPETFVPTTHNLYTVMDVHAPQSEIDAMTDGWFVKAMPDLNQRNTHLAKYLIQNSIWWIEYAQIDGIRHDTHPYADFDFLSRWCRAIFEEYPHFNIVGESWYIDAAPLAWWQNASKLNGRQTSLKTVMDFKLMNVCNQAFSVDNQDKNPLRGIYEVIAQDFLYEDLNNILIFLDNHDLSRFCKQGESDLSRFKQAMAFLLTTRGIPQLYYGTEILMNGEKSEGDGHLRKDFPGGWCGDSVNAFTAAGRTDLQNEAFDYLKKLLQWRKHNPAVKDGKLIHYAPESQTQSYVYARIAENSRILVILNGSNQEQSLSAKKYFEVIGDAVSGKEIISGKTLDLSDRILIPAKEVYILEL